MKEAATANAPADDATKVSGAVLVVADHGTATVTLKDEKDETKEEAASEKV